MHFKHIASLTAQPKFVEFSAWLYSVPSIGAVLREFMQQFFEKKMPYQLRRNFILSLILLSLVGCGTTSRLMPSVLPMKDTDVSVGLEELSIQAMALVDTPYRYSGNTPDTGFDCSGFVRYVVRRVLGVNLPRTVKQIALKGHPLTRSSWAPGDLIFFATVVGEPYSHVGIYVGQGRFVHAPATGGKVRLEQLNKPYWLTRLTGARRLEAVSAE